MQPEAGRIGRWIVSWGVIIVITSGCSCSEHLPMYSQCSVGREQSNAGFCSALSTMFSSVQWPYIRHESPSTESNIGMHLTAEWSYPTPPWHFYYPGNVYDKNVLTCLFIAEIKVRDKRFTTLLWSHSILYKLPVTSSIVLPVTRLDTLFSSNYHKYSTRSPNALVKPLVYTLNVVGIVRTCKP